MTSSPQPHWTLSYKYCRSSRLVLTISTAALRLSLLLSTKPPFRQPKCSVLCSMSCEQFASCVLTPVEGDAKSSPVTSSALGKWKTSSFYLDSSGRSSIALPLQLQFPSKEVLDSFVALDCIRPRPENALDEQSSKEETAAEKERDDGISSSEKRSLISIEAKVTLPFGTGQAIAAKVEGVNIVSTSIEAQTSSVRFDTEIIVRVSRAEGGKIDSGEASGVKTNLEIAAAFAEQAAASRDPTTSALEILNALSHGGGALRGSCMHSSSHRRVSTARLPPFELHVALTHALSIAVRSVSGPAMGQTFLALTVMHSNTHQQPVKITSIALHPGVTRQQGQDPTVADMSNAVKWGYAPSCDPKLPLTVMPNETYSAILTVDAREDSLSRRCYCPLSLTATVGTHDNCHIVAATDAHWTTSRAAVEPADSFLVDMSLDGDGAAGEDGRDPPCVVGSPLTVSVEITNLSTESRQLMLLVDSSDSSTALSKKASGSSSSSSGSGGSNRWAIVSEIEGYKFGVVGPPDRDQQELLVVDAALLLGELKGQSSTKARLRVIPLREGCLSIPNFILGDSRSGKRYNCVHKLQAVAQAAN